MTGEIITKIRNGNIDLEERISSQMKRIKKFHEFNAFTSVNRSKNINGPSLAIKDNILVKGMKSTGSSKILENYKAPYDATAVEKIRDDFTIIGKTSNDSFGAGGSGTNSDFGPVRNPHDKERIPGGSSSGNGVALALDMCDFALGSDTFGSVRAPASFCGVVGMRPTYGLVSRYGLMDLCMSMDTIGPMAKDVYGVAYLLSKIAGKDKRDLNTETSNIKNYHERLEDFDLDKPRVFIPKNLFSKVDDQVLGVVNKKLKDLRGFLDISRKRIEELEYTVPSYYLTMFAEFSSAMQKYDGVTYGEREDSKNVYGMVSRSRDKYLNKELKRRIILGTYITLKENKEKWYRQALKGISCVKESLNKIFQDYDFIITPTMPTLPWKIHDKISPIDEYKMDLFTGLASMGDLPAISIPCGKVKELPVGMQIIGDKFEDLKVLQLAHKIEERCGCDG